MEWWVWALIVAGVIVAFALLAAIIGTPARRREAKREEAADLRRDAEEKLATAARREVTARQEAAAAEGERLAAERALEEADAVDPDVSAERAATRDAEPA
jgi:hypothetical protein